MNLLGSLEKIMASRVITLGLLLIIGKCPLLRI
jgi:hypothetical protein